MVHDDRAEFFGRFDAVFLGEQVDCVLLGVGGDDFFVVALDVCRFADEFEVGGDFKLADGVEIVVAVDVEELHGALAVPVVAELEAAAGVGGGGERQLRGGAGTHADDGALAGARVRRLRVNSEMGAIILFIFIYSQNLQLSIHFTVTFSQKLYFYF